MSTDLILFQTTYFLLSMALLPVVAWIFKFKFGGSWKAFFLVTVTQLIFFLIFSVYIWSNVSTAAASVLGSGILAGITVVSGLFGLLLFPIVFLLIEKFDRWKLFIKRLLFVYAISTLTLLSPIFVTLTGITSNVDLYGKVVDIDGNPVDNAVVQLSNCGYIKDNPVTTDSNGIFNAVATCDSYFSIKRIYNPDTDTDCQSGFFILPGKNLITFDSFQREEEPHQRPHWINYTRETPYLFTCVWRKINTNTTFTTYGKEVIPDGRPYTITRGRSRLTIKEGAQHKGFRFSMHLDKGNDSDPETPKSGRLVISSVGGGIQTTQAQNIFNVAPLQGYREKETYGFTSHLDSFTKYYYFHSQGKAYYGVFKIRYNHKTGRGNTGVSVKLWFDTAGSRVILSHKARPNHYLANDLFF